MSGEDIVRKLDRDHSTASPRGIADLPGRLRTDLHTYATQKGKHYFATRGYVIPTPTKRLRASLGQRPSSVSSVYSSAQKRGRPNTADSQTQQNLPPLLLYKTNKEVAVELEAVLEDDSRKQKALEASIASRIKNIKGLVVLERKSWRQMICIPGYKPICSN